MLFDTNTSGESISARLSEHGMLQRFGRWEMGHPGKEYHDLDDRYGKREGQP